MVKNLGVPLHPSIVGVTIKLETMGLIVLLIAINAGISPTPLAPNPIFELLLVQL